MDALVFIGVAVVIGVVLYKKVPKFAAMLDPILAKFKIGA